jgi:hypothetical protein
MARQAPILTSAEAMLLARRVAVLLVAGLLLLLADLWYRTTPQAGSEQVAPLPEQSSDAVEHADRPPEVELTPASDAPGKRVAGLRVVQQR